MRRALVIVSGLLGVAAAAGCAGAEIDRDEFNAVKVAVIGCMKSPDLATPSDPAAADWVGDLAVPGAHQAMAETIRTALEEWGVFKVVAADTAAKTGPYKALGTASRGYSSHDGTYMLAADNIEAVKALIDDTRADAVIFVEWNWSIRPETELADGPGLRKQMIGVSYHGELRLSMYNALGTRIWFSRARGSSETTEGKNADMEFTNLVPFMRTQLMQDASAALQGDQ